MLRKIIMKKFEQNYLLNRSGVDEISKKLESYHL